MLGDEGPAHKMTGRNESRRVVGDWRRLRETWNRGGPEAADDGATSRSVEELYSSNVDNVKKSKSFG